jgi:hypothetical protein
LKAAYTASPLWNRADIPVAATEIRGYRRVTVDHKTGWPARLYRQSLYPWTVIENGKLRITLSLQRDFIRIYERQTTRLCEYYQQDRFAQVPCTKRRSAEATYLQRGRDYTFFPIKSKQLCINQGIRNIKEVTLAGGSVAGEIP